MALNLQSFIERLDRLIGLLTGENGEGGEQSAEAAETVSSGAENTSDEDPEALVVDTPEEGSVGKLLEVLDDESRELVFKKYYEQKSNKQIALEMDMNASTVSTKLSRAMAKRRTVAQREGL